MTSGDLMPFERMIAIRLVSHDAAALAEFYVTALGFERGPVAPIAAQEMALLGLAGAGSRISLTLAGQVLEIDQFDSPGAPYPLPGASNDGLFQHFAIVTADMAPAWARVLAAGGRAISPSGPVQLPPENDNVCAVKFRDPEGHPLELLSFPPGAGAQRLGINHSAIAVRDVAASLAFYRARGFTLGQCTLNHGAPQAALDGLPDPRVDIVPLNPPGLGSHLELLGYREPPIHLSPEWQMRDVAATRLVWQSDRPALIADPDGHLQQCQPLGTPLASP